MKEKRRQINENVGNFLIYGLVTSFNFSNDNYWFYEWQSERPHSFKRMLHHFYYGGQEDNFVTFSSSQFI